MGISLNQNTKSSNPASKGYNAQVPTTDLNSMMLVPMLGETTSTPKEAEARGDDQGVDFGRYLFSVRKRIWWIVIFMLFGGLISTIYTKRLPKLYASSATIIVDTNTPRVLTQVTDVVDSSGGWYRSTQFKNTQLKILESREVARKAGERLNIRYNDERNGLAGLKNVDPELYEEKVSQLDAADLIHGRYRVESEDDNQVVRISVIDRDPEFAASLANAVSDTYIDMNLDTRISNTTSASEWLSIQHQEWRGRLEKSEAALQDFLEDNGVMNASLDSQFEEVKQRLSAFIARRAETEAEEISRALTKQALGRLEGEPELFDTLPEIRDNVVIVNIKGTLLSLQSKRMELSSKYQDQHPTMIALNSQEAELKHALDSELKNIEISLSRELQALAHTRKGLDKVIEDERSKEARLNRLSFDYNKLKRDVEKNTKLYDMVTDRLKETELTGAYRFNNVRSLDPALVPSGPFSPKLSVNLLAGLVLGLILGILLSILVDVLDRTLKSQDDVEMLIDRPFLGILPIIPMEEAPPKNASRLEMQAFQSARDRYVMDNPKSTAAEFVKFIRTNILFTNPDKRLKTLATTSPGPQEGKSTCSILIANAMAEAGSRVLLVDADLRRPRLHNSFNLVNDIGLSTLIIKDTPLSEVVQESGEPNLKIMTSGPIPPNPTELLHAERFSEVVAMLEDAFDYIVFDAPPIAAVADPLIVGSYVDGMILVLRANQTTRQAAGKAYSALKAAKAPVLGTVLNNVDLSRQEYGQSGQYYYYYRQYGYYQSDADLDEVENIEDLEGIG